MIAGKKAAALLAKGEEEELKKSVDNIFLPKISN